MLRNELLFPTAAQMFLEDSAGQVRTEDSRKTYRKVLRHLQDTNPGRRCSEFTEADLVQFCNQDGLSPNTLLQRRSVCEAFFRWAHWRQLTATDPSVGLKRLVKIRARMVRHGNWLSLPQLVSLVAACDDGTELGQRDHVLIVIAGLTGLRRAELCGLRWGDVDLTGQTIRVVGKGEKPATVGINDHLREVLFRWRGAAALGLGRPPAAADPVLPRARSLSASPGYGVPPAPVLVWSEPAGRNAIYLAVKKRAALAGVPAVAPHDLRRTFIGLAEGQMDLITLSKVARHANVGTTQRYIESNPRRAVEAGQKFDIAL